MSFLQLYYTSCERGLSGYAGYQFNAITPGTSADTRDLVESLTGYEAPQSFVYTADRAALFGCPVNLCYVPGPMTIVANVQYVGQDSSKRRFGNYFAHALATTQADADLTDVLPIELWRAPFWVADQAETPDLPPFDGPLAVGELSRSETSRFIAAHRHRDQLPALLSAVGRSFDGTDLPVLVVEDDSGDVARWFAAVSYLLPEHFVRQLSFATYLSRPSRSRLHLRGTVTETDFDLGADATEHFSLFDFSGDRFSELRPHPLAALSARVDISVSGALWTWAAALASGDERSFDDWYPVAAAAAALGQIELNANDVAAAASWLDRAEHIPASRESEIAWALHDCQAVTRGPLVLVRNVAKRSGDELLYEQSQCELFEGDMLARMAGQPEAAASAPITETAIRDKVSARCQEALQHCDSVPHALRLLDWAVDSKLTLDPEVVTRSTREFIAPWLLAETLGRPLPPELRERALRIAKAWPRFRAGIVGCLVDQGSPYQQVIVAAMSGLMGELLIENDLANHPELGELYLICTARRKRDRGAGVLVKIAQRRGDRPVDEELLQRIWPSGGWERSEAVELLDKLGDKQKYGDGVLAWFYRATETDLRTPADLKTHLALCARLLKPPVVKALSAEQKKRLSDTISIDRVTREAEDIRQLVPAINAYSSTQSPVFRQAIRGRIVTALMRVQAGPAELTRVLLALDATTFGAYLAQVEKKLNLWATDAHRHLAALWLFGYAAPDDPQANQGGALVDWAVAHWRSKELDKLAELIATADGEAAAEFSTDVKEVRSGLPRRVIRSAAGVVSGLTRSNPGGRRDRVDQAEAAGPDAGNTSAGAGQQVAGPQPPSGPESAVSGTEE
jgi:GTPase-associated protein 1, N-terminal domain type 2/GTPase-associated protein 1, C-terminal domain/GTPase-associated protein 1, middle domain